MPVWPSGPRKVVSGAGSGSGSGLKPMSAPATQYSCQFV